MRIAQQVGLAWALRRVSSSMQTAMEVRGATALPTPGEDDGRALFANAIALHQRWSALAPHATLVLTFAPHAAAQRIDPRR